MKRKLKTAVHVPWITRKRLGITKYSKRCPICSSWFSFRHLCEEKKTENKYLKPIPNGDGSYSYVWEMSAEEYKAWKIKSPRSYLKQLKEIQSIIGEAIHAKEIEELEEVLNNK